MGQTADQLRQEIDQKREDAGEKIGAIEAKVEGTVQQVKGTVDDTVEKAKGTVDETVQKMKESVDLVKQVEERPLVALGAALAGGFLLGKLVGGGQGDQQPGGQAAGQPRGGTGGPIRDAVKSSGLEETLSSATAALMGMLTEKVRSALDESFPALAETLKQQGGPTAPPRGAGEGARPPLPVSSAARPAPPARVIASERPPAPPREGSS